jgi:hypothetical protein
MPLKTLAPKKCPQVALHDGRYLIVRINIKALSVSLADSRAQALKAVALGAR